MNIKKLTLLVLTLAVLSAITWLIKRPSPPPGLDPRTGEDLISRETLAAARTITLRNGENQVTLSAGEDGDSWQVEDYHGFPVDFTKLSTLARNMQNAKIIRLVTRNPERMERLDLGESRLSIDTGGAVTAYELEIGKTSEGGGRFVRFADEDRAYLTDLSASIDATPKNWAQSRLLDFSADEVAEIELGFGGETEEALVVSREDPGGDWDVSSEQESGGVKTRDLANLINRLTGLRFSETDEIESQEAQIARANARLIGITLFDGTHYTVELGRRPAEPAPVVEESPQEESATEVVPEPKPGPVYVFIDSNRENDPIKTLMTKRSFRVSDYSYTSLPADAASLLEPASKPEPDVAAEPVGVEEIN